MSILFLYLPHQTNFQLIMNTNNILLFEDLEHLILQILERSARYDIGFKSYIDILYNTGMRPVEALQKERFLLSSQDRFIFQPAKNNNVRTLNISAIPTPLLNYYFSNSIILQPYYYKRFQRIFNTISNTRNYYVDGRSLGLYIFRYYYVRKLYVDGMSYEDITLHMGWKNQFLAFKYVTRPITFQ